MNSLLRLLINSLFIIDTLCFGYVVIDIDVGGKMSRPEPPPSTEAARFARYIVHYSDWGTLAHTSFQPSTNGYPMSRILSTVDGTLSKSTGTPYFYITKKDDGVRDLLGKDNRCSVTISMAEGDYCQVKNLDPEDPRCPQVILTGRFFAVDNTTDEYKWAKSALFSRHPQMNDWPKTHNFFVAKTTVESITLVNNFGGNKYPNVDDYYKADPIPEEINMTFVVN